VAALGHEAGEAGRVGVDDARVSDDREAVGATHQTDRGSQRQTPPVDPGRRAAGQETLEGFGDRSDVAAAPHGLTDVRPSGGAAPGDRGKLLGLDRVPERPQTFQDLGIAHVAVAAQVAERPLHLGARRCAGKVAQQVDGHLGVLEVDLDPGTTSTPSSPPATRASAMPSIES